MDWIEDRTAVAEAIGFAAGWLAGLAHRDRCKVEDCPCRSPLPEKKAEIAIPDPYISPRARPWGNTEVKREAPVDPDDVPLDGWK